MRAQPPCVGALFNFDWDADGFARAAGAIRLATAGFDLFSFPSNLRLPGFTLERFVAGLVPRARRERWAGVVSHHEQFGALAAALLAERLGLPGTRPEAVLACQHKLHARRVLQQVCPQASVAFAELPVRYGDPIPEGLTYPAFVKPVKAAFSVLAKEVANRDELTAHTRFSAWELWVIRHLVEPFERVARTRLPEAGSAHRLMLEAPVHAAQFNLDGWVQAGQAHLLGVVDAVMYPGTQAFMRFEFPSRLPQPVQARALAVAQAFLQAVGFEHGFFNMEFFYDAAADRLTVIEFNPRLASQLADLYRRVLGLDAHAMSLALALGEDALSAPGVPATAGAAASFVYRAFEPDQVPPQPTPAQVARLREAFPDSLWLPMPKHGSSLARDFKWLGSHRYGVLHLGARDAVELQRGIEAASRLLGWPTPDESAWARPTAHRPPLDPLPQLEGDLP